MSSRPGAFAETVADRSLNLLVIAPPGCGKTELLARRAEVMIPTLGAHQKILALTFSNKAKANLAARLVQVLGTERKRRYVAVHNFHGHAAEIVRSHGATLGIATDFTMPDKRTQADAIAQHLHDLDPDGARDLKARVEEELREAKQAFRSDEEVLAVLAEAHPLTLRVETERQQAAGVLFYDDLLRHAQRLLRVPQIARLYQAHYAAILVDEFQDLSPQQLDVALRTCHTSRTFVGDPLQGIYSWTGARPIQVERVLRRIAGEPRGLGVSYRSSPRVLRALGAVSVQLGGQELVCHEPEGWFEGGMVALEAFSTGEDEAAFLRDTAASILEHQPSASIGVISRMGWRRKLVDSAFAPSGLPCTRWDLAVDNPRILEIIRHSVDRLGSSAAVSEVKGYLGATVGVTDVDTFGELVDALDQIGEIIARTGSIAAALDQMRVINEGSHDVIGPGVHLLNAHTGKGQQFDWVFIPGFEENHIPSFLAKSPAQLAEEHRILLVMISRARHGIVLTRSMSLVAKRTGRTYSPRVSRWQSELAGHDLVSGDAVLPHLKRMRIAALSG